MKTDKAKAIAPVVVAFIIVALAAVGFWRKNNIADSSVAIEYAKPGGDTLTVAIEMSPLSYFLANDTAEGFDYEVLKDIARIHRKPVKFIPFANLDKAFAGLYDNKYDVLVAAVPATSNIKKYFEVTTPVYLDRRVLVQLRDSAGNVPVSSQEQLMGDSVWIAKGSPAIIRLRNMAKELGDSIYIRTIPDKSPEHLAIMTALGQIPRAVVSESVAKRIATDYPGLDYSTPISFNQFQCWAVAPDNPELVDSLNSWLQSFTATQQFADIKNKYFPQ